LTHLLGEYRDHIVVVGGWVPDLLLGNKKTPHVGSMDVDLALDHRSLKDEGYKTIRKLLLEKGYEEGEQPFVFNRKIEGKEGTVEVDFLSGEYGGTGRHDNKDECNHENTKDRK